MRQRRSGVLVPLFSLTSSQSWGVGEFPDLARFAPWLQASHQAFVQILPITEVPDDETSPYSALTAMAIDAIHISLAALPDFEALGGVAALPDDDRAELAALRASRRVEHTRVRALKLRWLRRAHERFATTEEGTGSERAQRYEAFCREHASWLDDYAMFRALRVRHDRRPWWEWPAPLARGDARALEQALGEPRDEIAYRKYAQWVAAEQWAEARRHARPLQVFGDVPFMISRDSPDVWRRQDQFRFDATVGVPPDAFSETGQDWGLPPMRWDVMKRHDFDWIRQRARRTAQLFDGFRLDHLVGLYRTYVRPIDKKVKPFFTPAKQKEQTELGERLVSIYRETGAEIIAEDLGTVPDFVRESLLRLGVPGYKVLRWERVWTLPDEPYIDPKEYPEISVATTGTHDTEPLVTWWEELDEDEQRKVTELPSIQEHLAETSSALDAMLRALLDSRSRLVILPVQDVFGWPDRVNTPGAKNADNWTWRMPYPVDHMADIPEARERAAALAEWTSAAAREQ